jgi:hypothetical protein
VDDGVLLLTGVLMLMMFIVSSIGQMSSSFCLTGFILAMPLVLHLGFLEQRYRPMRGIPLDGRQEWLDGEVERRLSKRKRSAKWTEAAPPVTLESLLVGEDDEVFFPDDKDQMTKKG